MCQVQRSNSSNIFCDWEWSKVGEMIKRSVMWWFDYCPCADNRNYRSPCADNRNHRSPCVLHFIARIALSRWRRKSLKWRRERRCCRMRTEEGVLIGGINFSHIPANHHRAVRFRGIYFTCICIFCIKLFLFFFIRLVLTYTLSCQSWTSRDGHHKNYNCARTCSFFSPSLKGTNME